MKKIIISFISIITIILFCSVISYAAALEARINILPDRTEVEQGESVVFTIDLQDVANAEGDIVSAIEGKIEYDADFFENMSYTGITMNTATGEFSRIDSFSNESSIGTITLKVKDDAEGSGNVTFSELKADDGREDYTQSTATTEDVSYTINIKQNQPDDSGTEEGEGNQDGNTTGGEEQQDQNTTGEEEQQNQNTTGGEEQQDQNTTGEEEQQNQNTTGEEEQYQNNNIDENTTIGVENQTNSDSSQQLVLPYTGNKAVLIPLSAILIVASVGAYLKYRKYKDIV